MCGCGTELAAARDVPTESERERTTLHANEKIEEEKRSRDHQREEISPFVCLSPKERTNSVGNERRKSCVPEIVV